MVFICAADVWLLFGKVAACITFLAISYAIYHPSASLHDQQVSNPGVQEFPFGRVERTNRREAIQGQQHSGYALRNPPVLGAGDWRSPRNCRRIYRRILVLVYDGMLGQLHCLG